MMKCELQDVLSFETFETHDKTPQRKNPIKYSTHK